MLHTEAYTVLMSTCQGQKPTITDVVYPFAHDVSMQRLEPKLGTPRC